MISDDLLEILRCPVAVHYTDKGDDPGRLRLVHDCWLVCDDSGCRYLRRTTYRIRIYLPV